MAFSRRLIDTGIDLRADVDALEVTTATHTSQLAQIEDEVATYYRPELEQLTLDLQRGYYGSGALSIVYATTWGSASEAVDIDKDATLIYVNQYYKYTFYWFNFTTGLYITNGITRTANLSLSGLSSTPDYTRDGIVRLKFMITRVDGAAFDASLMHVSDVVSYPDLVTLDGSYLEDGTVTAEKLMPAGAFTMGSEDGKKYTINISALGALSAIPNIPSKTVFIGNSILLGMDADGAKGGAFGMAATDATKDYAYLVQAAITAQNGAATFDKISASPYEGNPTQAVLNTYLADHTAEFTGASLVIIQIGDNVNTAQKLIDFAVTFPQLVAAIRAEAPATRILCVGRWWYDATVYQIVTAACLRYGAMYVSINSLHTTLNEGTTGATVTYLDASTGTILAEWATHPGNSGMAAIATKIINAINM